MSRRCGQRAGVGSLSGVACAPVREGGPRRPARRLGGQDRRGRRAPPGPLRDQGRPSHLWGGPEVPGRAAVAEKHVRSAIALGLREKELGVLAARPDRELGRILVAAEPALARYASWLELLAGLPNKVKGNPGFDATGGRTSKPSSTGSTPGPDLDGEIGGRAPADDLAPPPCAWPCGPPSSTSSRKSSTPKVMSPSIPAPGSAAFQAAVSPCLRDRQARGAPRPRPGILRGPLLPRRGRPLSAASSSRPSGTTSLSTRRSPNRCPSSSPWPRSPSRWRRPKICLECERKGPGPPADLPRRPARQGALPRLSRAERGGAGRPRPPPRARHLLYRRRPLLDGLEPQRARAPRRGPQGDRGGQGLPRRRERRHDAFRDHRLPAGPSRRRREGPPPGPRTSIPSDSDAAFYLGRLYADRKDWLNSGIYFAGAASRSRRRRGGWRRRSRRSRPRR